MFDTIHQHGGNCSKGQPGSYEKLFLDILNLLIKNFPTMANEIEKISAEVSEATTVQASAALLLKSLHDRLIEAGTDKAKLTALANDLDQSSNALAAAVAANTIADNEGGGDTGTGNTGGDGGTVPGDGTGGGL